ncbi:hypothetical protein N9P17_07100 [Tateyamaria sp.]|nr:hypothetical protein [Tateyamaria sp.]
MESDDMEPAQLSRTAKIRQLAKLDSEAAVVELTAFLHDVFDIEINDLRINHDQYSLNSLNGFFQSNGIAYFFKFHQEEGEEDMQGEYYRAEIVADAGLPIDMPIMMSTQPGEQILVYTKREDKRFSDVLLMLDKNPDDVAELRAANAEKVLNQQILTVALRTLHPVTPQQVAEEPMHHLFFDRMVNLKTGQAPGGRYKDFYIDKEFEFPGVKLSWDEFSNASLVINGQRMQSTFDEIFKAAVQRLNPVNLADAGGFTAHGDAHNANVWYKKNSSTPTLSYFDPAFAGKHIPSLLAEAKATFHNVFAHPLWLYDSNDAVTNFQTETKYRDGNLFLDNDWKLSRVRERLLEAKIEGFWRPFLKELAAREMLPATWQQTLRSALAMCPALVMNLRGGADRHSPGSSAIAFSMVGLCGSAPEGGSNLITDFFDQVDPLRMQ